jgi:hypothetical protein
MSFQGTVLQCLISSPSDVPLDDLATVRLEINRWNATYGRAFGTAIMPISWGTNAAAEFGQPPQDILNRQIVDQCDMCIAIFAARLGTPTKNAVSGTAEEIERLLATGKYVAVLRSERGVKPSKTDPDQLKELEQYLSKISENGLVMTYSTNDELATNVQMIMASAAMRDHTRSAAELDRAGYADVWPRVEHEDRSLSGGRLYRNWYLALANVGSAPARDVYIKTEPIREGRRCLGARNRRRGGGARRRRDWPWWRNTLPGRRNIGTVAAGPGHRHLD